MNAASPTEPVPIGSADLEDVLALNQRWVPHVGHLDRSRLTSILEASELALAVRDPGGRLEGFVIVLGAGADYDSPNYEYFSRRHDRFTYVDRIAVEPDSRGRGVGRVLYDAVAEHARWRGTSVVCAEVNTEPPNPKSQAFHERMGFVEVGRQWTYGHTVEVQMLELAV